MTPDQISQLIDTLTAKLGPAGTHLYEIALRQVYATAIVEVATFIVIGIAGLVAWPRMMRWHNASPQTGYSNDRDYAIMIFGLIWTGAFLISIVCLFDGSIKLLNPEYAAFQMIVSAVK